MPRATRPTNNRVQFLNKRKEKIALAQLAKANENINYNQMVLLNIWL